MASHSNFMTSILSIYDITSTAFMTSYLLSMTSHPRLWHLTPCNCDITATISVTSHQICLWIHIHSIWHQSHCLKTIQPLYLTSHPPYLYLCDLTLCIGGITHTACMISHILYVWHIMHNIRHHTHALWHHHPLVMTSKLLYLTSHTLYLTAYPLYPSSHPDYRS